MTAIDRDTYSRTEAALRDRERELSQLVDMVPSHLWRLTPDGEPIYFNKRMVDFLGLDVADIVRPGSTRLDAVIETAVHPDDRTQFRDAIRRSLLTGAAFEMRYRLRRADGVYRWMSSRAEPMRDGGGRIVQWYGLCHDIDDQTRAEESLRKNEEQLQQIIDTVPALIWRTTAHGIPDYLNKRVMEAIGTEVADLIAADGSRFLSIVHPDDRDRVEAALAESIQTGVPFLNRHRQRRPNGSHRWAECRAEPMRDESGAIVSWYGVSVDIHDQVTAEEAVQRNEQRLQQMIDAVPVRIWSMSREGGLTYFNKRYRDHFHAVIPGFDAMAAPTLETLQREMMHPEDAPKAQRILAGFVETGLGGVMRFRLREGDGSYRWAECRVEPLRDEGGSIVQWYGVSLDIDDEVRAGKALRRREQQLRQLIDAVPVQIWSVTARGEPAYMNQTMLDYMGVKLEDYDVRAGMADVVRNFHPDDQPLMLAGMARSVETGEPFEMKYRCLHADGQYRWIQGRAVPLRDDSGRIVRWYGVNLDIHDMLTSQEALRERERELSLLVDMVPVLIGRMDANGEPTFFSKRTAEVIGLDHIAAFDRPGMSRHAAMVAARVHPDDAPQMADIVRHALATGEPYTVRFRRLALDGAYRWMEGRAEPLRDESGTILQWYTASMDIDDVVRAQETLRERERELSLLIEMVPVHIVRMAPDGEPTFFSQRTLKSIGMSDVSSWDKPGMSRTLNMVEASVHPEDAPRHNEVMKHAFATGQPYIIRYRRRRADGVYRWMEGRANPLRDESGAIVQWYAAIIDVDDEVRAQEALQERQKEREQAQAKLQQLQADFAHATRVSMLGELTASIAHEVNQPLAAIAASSQASLNWLAGSIPNIEKVRKLTEDVVADAQRASEIIGSVRAMAARRPPAQTILPLDDVIRDALLFLRHEVERCEANVSHFVASHPQKVLGDRTQLQQVLVNLAMNAMQAMMQANCPKRVIHIRTTLEEPRILRCSVEDSGLGIDPRHRGRLFDSFFTTKESGMGMGLRICRSVIESHGGHIEADNVSPLGGARFHFTLPIAADA